jgi:endonuclease III
MKKIDEVYRRFSMIYPPSSRFVPESKIHAEPFASLVGVMLSAQTRDEMTAKACNQLFAVARTPQQILDLSDDELRERIRPVGMYNTKTKNLKKMATQLIERHNGEVPKTREELMSLAGVGRKSTDIMMRFVYHEGAIAVDTHVHRLSNRLGLINTPSADATADYLAENTPEKYKMSAHEWFINYGKYVCRARSPKCDQCVFTDICDFYKEQNWKKEIARSGGYSRVGHNNV